MSDELTRHQPSPLPPTNTEPHRGTVFGLAGGPGVGTPAELRLSSSYLEVEAKNGERRSLTYDELSVSFGGAQDDQLVLQAGNPAQGGVVLYIRDAHTIRALREIAPAVMKARLQQADGKKRGKRRGATAAMIAALAIIAAVAWLVIKGMGAASEIIVARIPHTWEVELGKQAAKSTLAGNELVQDPVVTDAVQLLVGRLAKALPDNPYEFHVQVVEEAELNAFALPGGEIVVYTGLIGASESPEEVAGVLAHEMHHVVQRHGLKRIVRTVGIIAIVQAAFGDAAGVMAIIRDRASGLASLKYDRGQETEADVKAVKTLAAAGISPEGMVTFFERLSEHEGKLAGALSFASTHPASRARMDRLRKEIARLPAMATRPTVADWEAVRGRCNSAEAPPAGQ